MGLKSRHVCTLLIIIMVLTFCPFHVCGESLLSLEITQYSLDMPDLRVYFNIYNDEDMPVQNNLDRSDISASLGGTGMEIDHAGLYDKNQGTAYIILVDISKSLSDTEFEKLKKGLLTWVDKASENDFFSLITFGDEVRTTASYTNSSDSIKELLGKLQLTDNSTRFYGGIERALKTAAKSDSDVPERKVIIAFSDGIDDYAGGETKQEIIRQLKASPVPVCSIATVNNQTYKQDDEGLETMGELSRISGGYYTDTGKKDISSIFAEFDAYLKSCYLLKCSTGKMTADGSIKRLHLVLREGSGFIEDGVDLRLTTKDADLIMPSSAKYEADKEAETVKEAETEKPTETESALAADAGTSTDVSKGGSKNSTIIFVSIIVLAVLVIALITLLGRKSLQRNKGPENQQEGKGFAGKEAAVWEEIPPAGSEGEIIEVMVTVNYSRKNTKKYKCPVGGSFIIGRSEKSHLKVEDSEISREQCELAVVQGKLIIRDLDSTNGTIVNGYMLSKPAGLSSGDVILIGRTELKVAFSE